MQAMDAVLLQPFTTVTGKNLIQSMSVRLHLQVMKMLQVHDFNGFLRRQHHHVVNNS